MISASSSNTRGFTVVAPLAMPWLASASSTFAALATARLEACFYPLAPTISPCWQHGGSDTTRELRAQPQSPTLALAGAQRCLAQGGAAGAGRVPHWPAWPRLVSIWVPLCKLLTVELAGSCLLPCLLTGGLAPPLTLQVAI